jgi:AraC family transcriptional regulator
MICSLALDSLLGGLEEDLKWTDKTLEGNADLSDPAIANLILQLGAEARHPGFADRIMVEAIAMQIAVLLLRSSAATRERPAMGGLAAWRLQAIEDRLEDMRAMPTLGELAKICQISVRQLSRGFHASRGTSIGSYVADRRLEKAKQRLAGGECIKSVSHALGFSSSSTFCYAFQRATGFTPGEYQRGIT